MQAHVHIVWKNRAVVGLVAAGTALAGACGSPTQTGDALEAPTHVRATVAGNDVTLRWRGSGDSYKVLRQGGGPAVCGA